MDSIVQKLCFRISKTDRQRILPVQLDASSPESRTQLRLSEASPRRTKYKTVGVRALLRLLVGLPLSCVQRDVPFSSPFVTDTLYFG